MSNPQGYFPSINFLMVDTNNNTPVGGMSMFQVVCPARVLPSQHQSLWIH